VRLILFISSWLVFKIVTEGWCGGWVRPEDEDKVDFPYKKREHNRLKSWRFRHIYYKFEIYYFYELSNAIDENMFEL